MSDAPPPSPPPIGRSPRSEMLADVVELDGVYRAQISRMQFTIVTLLLILLGIVVTGCAFVLRDHIVILINRDIAPSEKPVKYFHFRAPDERTGMMLAVAVTKPPRAGRVHAARGAISVRRNLVTNPARGVHAARRSHFLVECRSNDCCGPMLGRVAHSSRAAAANGSNFTRA